ALSVTRSVGGHRVRVEAMLRPAVILNRADPVQVGGERRIRTRQAADGDARLQVERRLFVRRRRIPAFARRLHLDNGCEKRGGNANGGGGTQRHLKSRLEKTDAEIVSSIAIYTAAYATASAT